MNGSRDKETRGEHPENAPEREHAAETPKGFEIGASEIAMQFTEAFAGLERFREAERKAEAARNAVGFRRCPDPGSGADSETVPDPGRGADDPGAAAPGEADDPGPLLDQHSRSRRVLGGEAIDRLRACRIAVFGVGGVGGAAVEALARSGVGTIDVIDDDTVCLTNLNRQIITTRDAVGRKKVDAAAERVAAIDPGICVNRHGIFYGPDRRGGIDFRDFDFVVDAVDTVSAKLDIIAQAKEAGVPVISAMGCGNRLDPSQLRIADIAKTSIDPLARVLRRELRKRGIRGVPVVYSTEEPVVPLPAQGGGCALQDLCPAERRASCRDGSGSPGSTVFVPNAAGLLMASFVVRTLSGFDPSERTKSGRNRAAEEAHARSGKREECTENAKKETGGTDPAEGKA